ncbi:glycosyltransferase [Rufibacter quisquiliarum]|uniref:Glycosyltransferase involved in cell wall biosynthesis n=1 Tax=Rufibacter quisquiliarum TaxID=1549639 RepID=A0A839GX56_9BACT|nr:glycosyltransferase [Rufibacter quisquiliarum]MBA9079326.1 glycosyltransferase involved in cell wall biosynthesis [Rufibacter quisquiliarum]
MAHIVLIGPAYPFRGGLATFNERLARAWQQMGHQVEIITFTTQYPSVLFPGKTQLVEGPAPQGIDIKRRLSSVNPLTWLALGKDLQSRRPDIILFRYWLPFMGPSFGTVARLAKKNGHTKVVALTDNVVPHEKRPGDTAFTKYFLQACDAFVTMSDAVMQDLRLFEKKKPAVFHPHPLYDTYGVAVPQAEALQRLGLPQTGNYLLFFGFIRQYKGLDILLKAMTDPGMRERDIKLIVAGEFYEAPEPYTEIIRDGGLEDRVILKTEYIPDDKVALYFSAADLVVQPYRRATQSGVTQIAYHFDKPMIITRVGGLQEMIKDQEVGYTVEADPEAIATSIFRFFDEGRSEEMKANIQKEKLRFSWGSLAQTILDLVAPAAKT